MNRFLRLAVAILAGLAFVLTGLAPGSGKTVQAAGVVGTGTPASCTEAALAAALVGGGTVTFNCGGPATILILHPQTITQSTNIQGGGVITITGGLATQLFSVANTASFTLNDITLDAGFGTGTTSGGAIASNGFLTLNHVTIQNSQAGPNLCGGGIFVNGVVQISNSTFANNTAGFAGGAICTGFNSGVHVEVSNTGFNNNKTVETGTNTGKGGAIYVQTGDSLTVANSGFTGNTAQFGGAVYVDQGGTATFGAQGATTGIFFSSNSASLEGGAIWNKGTVHVFGAAFNSNNVPFNLATSGGAIANFNGLTLDDSSFVFNVGHLGAGLFVGQGGGAVIHRTLFNLGNAELGGGLYADDVNSFITIVDSVFSRNTGAIGGGIARLNAHIDISNSSFTDNTATNHGGNLSIDHSPANVQDPAVVNLTNVTIAGGITTLHQGGGLYNNGISVLKNVTIKDNDNGIFNTGLSQLNIFNTVLDNPDPQGLGFKNCDGGTPLTLGGNNLSTDNTCGVETNNVPSGLGVRALNQNGVNQTFYYAPLPGSPLVDAITGMNFPPTDQRGVNRPVGPKADIGAIELSPTVNPAADFDIPNGHFFKQANGQGGAGDVGFAVTDDGGITFWTAFQAFGGVPNVGFPVSQRFQWKGFTVQAFQKVVFQWRPESNSVAFVNIFDELSAAGKDDFLLVARSVPKSADWSSDQGKTFDQIIQAHDALLDQNPAIKQVYLSAPDPIAFNGLPMGAQDFPTVFVIRAQRKVFQQWKVNTSFANAGDVTVANGGDVGKETGLYPPEAIVPTSPPS